VSKGILARVEERTKQLCPNGTQERRTEMEKKPNLVRGVGGKVGGRGGEMIVERPDWRRTGEASTFTS